MIDDPLLPSRVMIPDSNEGSPIEHGPASDVDKARWPIVEEPGGFREGWPPVSAAS
jgi:hypothetical protein